MDATQPAKGVAPVAGMEDDGSPRRSFAQVLGKAMKDDLGDKLTDSTTFRKEGSPALRLFDSDVERGESHVSNHIVVMKFSSLRPSLDSIRESIHRSWGISGEFIMGLIDPRHVIVYLQSENEVKKVLSKDSFTIRGVRYKMFRWHPGFSLRADPELAPVWIELPNLPFAFFLPAIMKAIRDSFGNFLRIDDGTRYFARPKVARMCVEMEVSKPLPHRIWLESPKYGGYWQKLEYPGFKYCDHCSLIGHEKDYCRKLISRKREQSKVDGETNLENKSLDKDKQKQNQVGGKQDQSVKMQTHFSVAKKAVETKGNIGTSGAKNSQGVEVSSALGKELKDTPVVGTSGVKNSQGAEIITEVDVKRPVDNEPAKVVLSNKFESLTENFEEEVSVPANRQLFGKETTHDYAADGSESTEECLIEAGYTISETENACGKQKLTLQQEDGGDSGAVSRGAAGDYRGIVSAGQIDPALQRASSVVQIGHSGSKTECISPNTGDVAIETGCVIRSLRAEKTPLRAENAGAFPVIAISSSRPNGEHHSGDVGIQSEQLVSVSHFGGHHGVTSTEVGDAMQGQQEQEPSDVKFQTLLRMKRQFEKNAIKTSPDYKRISDSFNKAISLAKEYILPHQMKFNINNLESSSEDSDDVHSESEIGPQAERSDLDLGATSGGEMKKRSHTKDVSLCPRKSNRTKKANKRYKD